MEIKVKQTPFVQILSYNSLDILRITIDKKIYSYKVSPGVMEKFSFMLSKNVGRALALLRGKEYYL